MQNKNMVKGHLPNQKDMQPPIAKAPKQTTDQVQSQSKSGQKSVAKPNIVSSYFKFKCVAKWRRKEWSDPENG